MRSGFFPEMVPYPSGPAVLPMFRMGIRSESQDAKFIPGFSGV